MSEREKLQWSAQGETTKHAAIVKCEGHEVMAPVDRSSKSTSTVPAIDGIKSDYFCVMALQDDSLGLRKFSCFCGPCLAAGQNCWRTFAACENLDTCGPWVVVKMTDDGVELSNLHRILREEAERTFWPNRWHDECGLEGAPCARGCTEPGDTLLQCTYCPGAFHLDCVGLENGILTNLDHFSYPTHTIYNTVTLLVNTDRIIKLGSSRFSLTTSLQKWIKLITKLDHGMTP